MADFPCDVVVFELDGTLADLAAPAVRLGG
jgi:hypothetical protein